MSIDRYPTLEVIEAERRAAQQAQLNRIEAAVCGASVTRFEVIDHTKNGLGRLVVVTGDDVAVELSYQDDGRTLKVFLRDRKEQG